MWMMTKIGFYSIVEKPKDKICIRTRNLRDMIQLQLQVYQDGEIIETPLADYKYRMILTREYFEREFGDFAKYITYDNFKNEVQKTNRHREALYHQVWNIMRRAERED